MVVREIKLLVLVVLSCLLPGVAKGAVEDSVLVKRVLDFYETAAPERMVIHTDRDDCEPGEKISFRAYVVSEADNLDSQLTNFIYLDLYRNDGWQRISHKKYIRNENGAFSNYVEIPESLAPGEYTIVGYTQHMLRFPPETYAYKNISVGEKKEKVRDVSRYMLQLQPEGGRYIEGAVQKVGVRVAGDDELPGVFHVEVVDTVGKPVYTTETDPFGYATVRLLNDSLCPLRVNAMVGDGTVLSTEVPEAETNTAALKVNQGGDILKIVCLTHGDVDLAEMNVVVRASGVVFSVAADRVSHVKIPLTSLPDGYIDIDLVDDAKREVVSSRRVYKESKPSVSISR